MTINPALASARAALDGRRFDAALAAAERAVSELPGSPDSWAVRAETRRRLGDLAGALSDLGRALALAPGEPRLLGSRAEIRRRLGDWEGAAEDARALAAASAGPAGPAALAEAQRCAGRLRAALKAAAEAVRREPASAWPRVVRAKVLRALGRDRGALEELDRAAACEPEDYLARAWRGEALRALGRAQEARAELDAALRLEPACAWVYALRGQLGAEAGEPAAAERDLDTAFAMDPRASGAYDFLGDGRSGLAAQGRTAWAWAWRGLARQAAGDAAGALADLGRAVVLDAKTAWLRARLGEALARAGRWRRAAAQLGRALTARPLDRRALFWRGEARRNLKDPRGALRDLNLLMHLEPSDAGRDAPGRALYGYARVSRALALLAQGRRAEALGDLADGVRLLPETARAPVLAGLEPALRRPLEAALARPTERAERDWRLWAEELFRGGRGDAARPSLSAALRRRPSSGALHLLAWRALDAGGRGDHGRTGHLERAAQLGIETAEVCAWLGRARLERGRWAQGLELLARAARFDPANAWEHAAWPACSSALAADPATPRRAAALKATRVRGPREAVRRYLLARLALTLDRVPEALRHLDGARPMFAGCPWVLECVRGEALVKLGRFEAALAPLQRSAALAPAEPRPLLWRAEALYWLGRESESEACATDALRAAPGAGWARAWRAQLLLWLGRYAEAEGELDAALASEPSHAWAWGWRGAARVLQGRCPQGIADLRQALRLDPCDHEARLFLGEALARSGRPAAARRALDEALQLDPGQFWAWALRGWVRALAGDGAGAVADYRTAALHAPLLAPARDAAEARAALEALLRARRGNRTWRPSA